MNPRIDRRYHSETPSAQTATATSTHGSSTIADWLNISHELRTPANAILGHVELMLSGAMGPLSSETRTSLGDIQKAGLNLLDQVDQMIEVGQKLSYQDLSSPEIDALADLLNGAWAKAETIADAGVEAIPLDANGVQEHRPTRWLRVVAALLHDLGARQPRSDHPGHPSALPSMCDIDHSHLSELRLEYRSRDRDDFSICVTMIEAALMMTGGILDHAHGSNCADLACQKVPVTLSACDSMT